MLEECKGSDLLLDFTAKWCGHCQAMAPIVDEIEREYRDELKICKVDIDVQPDIAKKYKVSSIPTFILIKDGEVQKKHVGQMTKAEMKEFIE